jgi:hypothetical protein
MYQDYGKKLKERLVSLSLTDVSKMRGCSPEEIDALRQYSASGHLPAVYVQFLSLIGHDTGGKFIWDMDYTYESLDEKQEDAHEIAAADGISLPKDAFFFMSQSGTHFYFFHTSERDDNPPIYKFTEAKPSFEQVASSLADFYEGLALVYASYETE